MTPLLLALLASLAADERWDDRIDPACCPYPEHDPRDYNWPYSHFQYSEVIPDVVGSFVAMTSLNLTFDEGGGGGSGDAVVDYGKPLAPSRVRAAPRVRFALEPDRDDATLHTLMMVDPDVPFRDVPIDGEWVHWLVHDIPGNDTAAGKTLVEYAPPTPKPCPASDRLCLREHRVTFVLWEQSHGPLALHAEDVHIAAGASDGRRRYQARDFAARHRLGMPIALNFFETWHDPGDGSFDERQWWSVRDDEALAPHVVPHVERALPPDPSLTGVHTASAGARGSSSGSASRRRGKEKDEL